MGHGRGCVLAAGLWATAVALHRLGDGPLPAPPVRPWSAVHAWYGETGPSFAAMSLLRLVLLGLVVWLAVASVLHVAARSARCLQGLADALTPVVVRRLLHGAVGVTMSLGATTTSAGPASVAGAQPAPPAPTLDATATMRPLDGASEAGPHDGLGNSPATDTGTPPVPEPAPAAAAGDGAQEYQVAVGSHFWSIAEEIVRESSGRDPSDGEITRYWLKLIEANRDRLVVPENPDLLYPSQSLRLPAI